MIAAAWTLSALLLAAPSAGVPQLERDAAAHVRQAFERVGRAAPAADPALQAAARALAKEVLSSGAGFVKNSQEISNLVSEAGGADPAPRTVAVRAVTSRTALESFREQRALNQEPATHQGVGAALRGRDAVIIALFVNRKAVLDPFPRTLPTAGGVHSLCGELADGVLRPGVFVTRPEGGVDQLPLTRESGARFCASIPFPSTGRHSVEVIARGARGPEVVSSFHVEVGQARTAATAAARAPEPTTLPESREAILASVNVLRAAQQLQPLSRDERLDAVAQTYAEQMVRQRFFGHVDLEGKDLDSRLKAAGYAYARAGENLGMASGPLEAHRSIEHSPGHRKNLLTPEYSAVGLGVAWEQGSGHPQVVVVELLAQPPSGGSPRSAGDPLEAAYQGLERLRGDLRLPALKRSEVLERIASSHARGALEQDRPQTRISGSDAYERALDAVGRMKRVTVEVYVADDPGVLPRPNGASDARNEWMGAGAIKGDSRKYGKQRYWVVVIYASSR